MKVICLVPVRIGSERLPRKNLRLLNGKPLALHAIEIAKRSGVFDRIVLNADDEVFAPIAKAGGAEFYLRPRELGLSNVAIDSVILDFVERFPCEVVSIVNPPSPALEPEEVASAVRRVSSGELDSVIASYRLHRHTLYRGAPVNFATTTKLARTQDLEPLEVLCYSVMAWRSEVFRESMRDTGMGVFCGRFGTHPVSNESATAIKSELDFKMVERMMAAREEALSGVL